MRDDERNEPVEFDVTVMARTANGILVWDGSSEVWFPLSRVEGAEGLERGDEGTISVPLWLAEDRGWA